jgi:hypothetical protein
MENNSVHHLALLSLLILGSATNFLTQEEGNKTATNGMTQELDEGKIGQRVNDVIQGKVVIGNEDQEVMPRQSSGETADPMIPVTPNALLLDAPTKEKYLAALQEYYAYHKAGLQHRQRVFEWQLFSSKLIFVAVLLVVFAGIYFAAVQFHMGLAQKARVEGSKGEEVTEFAVSVKGIKVTSPVLGVVILVISLAFFYLYLVYVYPIEEIF